jgi:hypothetical protein
MRHSNTDLKIHRLVTLLGLLLILSQSACTTTSARGQRPDRNTGRVEIGDTVRIWTKDDAVQEFEVVALTLMSIIGTEGEVFSEDIIRVDIRDANGWRTTDVTVASILGAALLFVDGYALASISTTTELGQ